MLAFATIGALIVAACAQPPTPGASATARNEAFARAVLGAGFPCEAVTSSQELGYDNGTWRVACANAEVYTALLIDGGEICIEPMLFGDLVGPGGAVLSPESRCVTDVRLP